MTALITAAAGAAWLGFVWLRGAPPRELARWLAVVLLVVAADLLVPGAALAAGAVLAAVGQVVDAIERWRFAR